MVVADCGCVVALLEPPVGVFDEVDGELLPLALVLVLPLPLVPVAVLLELPGVVDPAAVALPLEPLELPPLVVVLLYVPEL